jgi:ABC-type transport system involved in multi-copper enzyme maturation permease subunit
LLLAATAYLVYGGARPPQTVGDLARFGAAVFELLSGVQLALALFFSALFTASAVAQEKDRRTMDLLLLTDLGRVELVLGKLSSSLLHVVVMVAGALPVFALLALAGGVSAGQIGRAYAVTLATVLAAGSLGAALALWREKTFQTLALVALLPAIWMGGWELLVASLEETTGLGHTAVRWRAALSPPRALAAAIRPVASAEPLFLGLSAEVAAYLAVALALSAAVCAWAMLRVRAWNTSGGPLPARAVPADDRAERLRDPPAHAPASTSGGSLRPSAIRRPVGHNPVLWRETRTWAYGRKVLLVRGAYLVLFAASAIAAGHVAAGGGAQRLALAVPLAPLAVCGLMLVNAQCVTSITGERDGRALDVLLTTELSFREILMGKLWGGLYNTKEMLVLPLGLCGFLWWRGAVGLEEFAYLAGALAVLTLFAAVLGIHCGLVYARSRVAVAVSLGTLFFLLVGAATCIAILTAFSEPEGRGFTAQLGPFLALIVGGSAGLYLALGARHASPAIGWAALACPMATFWAVTSFLLHFTLGVFLVTVATYGFATLAVLVPWTSDADARGMLGE